MFEDEATTIAVGACATPTAAAGCPPARRIEQVVAIERQLARLHAEQAELVAAHADDPGGQGATGWSVAERGTAAEIGLARGVSTTTAEHQVAASRALTRELPLLFDLLHRGEISWAGAQAVCRETWGVEAAIRAEIDRRLAAAVERGAAPADLPRPPRRHLPAADLHLGDQERRPHPPARCRRPHPRGQRPGPVGARHHLLDLPGWHVVGTGDRVVWTTPTGHCYESRSPPALGWASQPH